MKRVLKWIAIVVLGLITVFVILGLTIFLRGQSRIGSTYDVPHTIAAVTPDSSLLLRGTYLAKVISHCDGCHGKKYEGTELVDDPSFGYIPAPNLTSGRGGIGGSYTATDWERAIRHGVAADGRALVVMPSEFYQWYSDEDLKALISRLQSLPAVDNDFPERSIGPVAKLLIGSGQYDPPAFAIDHSAEHPTMPVMGITKEYGQYLVNLSTCGECHGADLSGQTIEGPPQGPDLTSNGWLGKWSEEDFLKAIRSGIKPDGQFLDPNEMPWPRIAGMSDTELQAIWAFLQTL